jgi:hypothetical protein
MLPAAAAAALLHCSPTAAVVVHVCCQLLGRLQVCGLQVGCCIEVEARLCDSSQWDACRGQHEGQVHLSLGSHVQLCGLQAWCCERCRCSD